VEQTGQDARQPEGTDQAERCAKGAEPQPLADDHREYLGRAGTQGHPHSDLMPTAAHGIGHHPVDPHGSE